jgi:predicted component of type VI protein secretion system
MNVRLLVANPNSATKQIRLGAKTLVGRSPECNLRIASGLVSRRHCLIKVDDAVVSVRDLGSANGTRLDGQPIVAQTEVPVPAGSTLAVGPLKFVVQFAAPKSRADEDTEWLPRLPPEQTDPSGKTAKSPDNKVANEIQSLIPSRPLDGEETKDAPASKRRPPAVVPNVMVSAPGVVAQDPGAQGATSSQHVDPGAQTVRDIAALASESVLDIPPETGPKNPTDAVAALERNASQTHLVFEEDDLKLMNLGSDFQPEPPTDDSESRAPDDGIDEELRKFLSES